MIPCPECKGGVIINLQSPMIFSNNANMKRRFDLPKGEILCRLGRGKFEPVESHADLAAGKFPYLLPTYGRPKDNMLEKEALLLHGNSGVITVETLLQQQGLIAGGKIYGFDRLQPSSSD